MMSKAKWRQSHSNALLYINCNKIVVLLSHHRPIATNTDGKALTSGAILPFFGHQKFSSTGTPISGQIFMEQKTITSSPFVQVFWKLQRCLKHGTAIEDCQYRNEL